MANSQSARAIIRSAAIFRIVDVAGFEPMWISHSRREKIVREGIRY
jgi:hypothetical protein